MCTSSLGKRLFDRFDAIKFRSFRVLWFEAMGSIQAHSHLIASILRLGLSCTMDSYRGKKKERLFVSVLTSVDPIFCVMLKLYEGTSCRLRSVDRDLRDSYFVQFNLNLYTILDYLFMLSLCLFCNVSRNCILIRS